MTSKVRINRIAVCGITGFIGRRLRVFLSDNNYQVVPITRKELAYAPKQLANLLKGCEAVINLAGAPVLKRWSDEWKKEIYNSRVYSTAKLVEAIKLSSKKPKVFISASAVGVYDPYDVHDEFSTHYATDYLGEVCQAWEAEALKLKNEGGLRLCIIRLGVVLGKDGGAFPKMVRPFKFGLGGKVGMGHQVMPFIHIKDVLSALWYLLKREASHGIYNFVAPEMISNEEWTAALARKTHTRALLSVPESIVKALYGDGADVVLKGQKVIPLRLKAAGFHFAYPDVEAVLDDLIESKK